MARFTGTAEGIPPREYEFYWRWGTATPGWFDDAFMGGSLWARLRKAGWILVRRPKDVS